MERLGSLLATQAGLPGKDATAEQLRALTADRLPQLGVYSVDGRMEPENSTRVMDAGRMADVPLLIGWTDFDGGSTLRSRGAEDVVNQASDELKAAYVSDRMSVADLGYQMYTDSHEGAPARWIAGKASRGAPSYLYLFSYVRTQNRGKVRGAAHGDDITFVFDNWEKAAPQLQLSDEDRVATRMMHSCWVSFAKTGKPSCAGVPDWPRYTPRGDQLMELGLKPRVRQHFRKRQLDAQERAWRTGANEAEKNVEDELRRLEESRLRPAG
jgi:para-nitrobenzyl esterase